MAATEAQRGNRHAAGLTLLEVLAAVAILGIVSTLLLRAGLHNVRIEGDSLRRVRAGVIADRTMGEIEVGAISGAFPEFGESESQEGDYLIRTAVLEFEAFADAQVPRVATAGGSSLDADAPNDVLELLTEEAPDLTPMLATIRVTVEWSDGAEDRSVIRNSMVLDLPQAVTTFGVEVPEEATGDDAEDEGQDEPSDTADDQPEEGIGQ